MNHVIDTPAFTPGAEHLFVADGGAAYWLSVNGHGERIALADRTRTEYRSVDNALKVTGKVRKHTAIYGGWGARAVLTLDTGEGLVEIPGVIR